MAFVHVKHDYPSLLREETESGERVYRTHDGKIYPSVTTILKDHNKEAIDRWKARVGHAEAKKISDRASTRGDAVHECIEAYLSNYPTSDFLKTMLPNAKSVYLNMRKELDKYLTEVHGIEQPMFTHKLRIAGTADCIGVYDNKLSIIDFKTALRLKKKEYVHGYFMQLTAYAFMFQEMTGLKIEQGVILIGVDNETFAQTFRLPKSEFGRYILEVIEWRDKYEQRIAA